MHVLIRLLGLLRPYRGRVLLAWLCLLASGGFVLVAPLIVQWAIDTGLGVSHEGTGLTADPDPRLLAVAALAIVVAALVRGAFAFGQQYLGEWLGQRVAYDLRNRIYDRLQRLSFAYHDRAQTGQLMSRATIDVDAVRMYFDRGVLRAAYLLLLLGAVFALMASTNLRLALIAWAFIPFIAYRSISTTMRLRSIWTRVQEVQGDMGAVLQENLSGVRVVRAFAQEPQEIAKFERKARQLLEDSYHSSRVQAFNGPLMAGLGFLAVVATNWYGAREIVQGGLTVGELSAFNLYIVLLQGPLRILGWMVAAFARAASAGARIYEILDTESAVREKPGALELRDVRGHVRFEDVGFGYDAISPTLDRIDIDAAPGSVVALLGPTGSGKSTVVNLMPRFYDVTAGRITIDGHDTRDVTLASLRRAIGVVQQDVFLFSATIRENIAYGVVGADEDSILAAAKAARIHDFIASLPDGYDTRVGERGITLSGGQKQRVAIARTLLTDPRILVLDDSTSSVDSETEELIQQALAELMAGRTTFVIAQRLKTVKRADQVLVLDRGQIVERGTHAELIERDGFYRQIYELELRSQEEARVPAAAAGAG